MSPSTHHQQIPLKHVKRHSPSRCGIPSTEISPANSLKHGYYHTTEKHTPASDSSSSSFDDIHWEEVPMSPVEYDGNQQLLSHNGISSLKTSSFLYEKMREQENHNVVQDCNQIKTPQNSSRNIRSEEPRSLPQRSKKTVSLSAAKRDTSLSGLERKLQDIVHSTSFDTALMRKLEAEREISQELKERLSFETDRNQHLRNSAIDQELILQTKIEELERENKQRQHDLEKMKRQIDGQSAIQKKLEQENKDHLEMIRVLQEQREEELLKSKDIEIRLKEKQLMSEELVLNRDFKIEQLELEVTVQKEEVSRLDQILNDLVPLVFVNEKPSFVQQINGDRELTLKERSWNAEVANIKKERLPTQLRFLLEQHKTEMEEKDQQHQQHLNEFESHCKWLEEQNTQLEQQLKEKTKTLADIELMNDQFEDYGQKMMDHYAELREKIQTMNNECTSQYRKYLTKQEAQETVNNDTEENSLPLVREIDDLLFNFKCIMEGLTSGNERNSESVHELNKRNEYLSESFNKQSIDLKKMEAEQRERIESDEKLRAEVQNLTMHAQVDPIQNQIFAEFILQTIKTLVNKFVEMKTAEKVAQEHQLDIDSKLAASQRQIHNIRTHLLDLVDKYAEASTAKVNQCPEEREIITEIDSSMNSLEKELLSREKSIQEFEKELHHLYRVIEESSAHLSQFVQRHGIGSSVESSKPISDTSEIKDLISELRTSINKTLKKREDNLLSVSEKKGLDAEMTQESLMNKLSWKTLRMSVAEACLNLATLREQHDSNICALKSERLEKEKVEKRSQSTSAANMRLMSSIKQGIHLLDQLVSQLQKSIGNDMPDFEDQDELAHEERQDLGKVMLHHIQRVTKAINQMKSEFRKQHGNTRKRLDDIISNAREVEQTVKKDMRQRLQKMESALKKKEQELSEEKEGHNTLKAELQIITARMKQLEEQQRQHDILTILSHVHQKQHPRQQEPRSDVFQEFTRLQEQNQAIVHHLWNLFRQVEQVHKKSKLVVGLEQQFVVFKQGIHDLLNSFKDVISSAAILDTMK